MHTNTRVREIVCFPNLATSAAWADVLGRACTHRLNARWSGSLADSGPRRTYSMYRAILRIVLQRTHRALVIAL